MDPSNYQSVYDSLGAVYDPQTSLVNKQIADLQPQQDAQQAALDQAKVNAFKDITNQSNARGVLFSGIPIEDQAQYTGTKYLPAVANLKTSFNNTKNTLLGQINTINQNRSQQASTSVAKAQAQASTDAYRQAQLDLGYARLGQSASNASNKPLTTTQTIGAIHDFLQGQKGSDNHVAPSVLASAYKTYLSAGGTDANFWKNFQGYWNSNQGNYKALFNAAKSAK